MDKLNRTKGVSANFTGFSRFSSKICNFLQFLRKSAPPKLAIAALSRKMQDSRKIYENL